VSKKTRINIKRLLRENARKDSVIYKTIFAKVLNFGKDLIREN